MHQIQIVISYSFQFQFPSWFGQSEEDNKQGCYVRYEVGLKCLHPGFGVYISRNFLGILTKFAIYFFIEKLHLDPNISRPSPGTSPKGLPSRPALSNITTQNSAILLCKRQSKDLRENVKSKFFNMHVYNPTFSKAAIFIPKCAKCLARNGSSTISSSPYENMSEEEGLGIITEPFIIYSIFLACVVLFRLLRLSPKLGDLGTNVP